LLISLQTHMSFGRPHVGQISGIVLNLVFRIIGVFKSSCDGVCGTEFGCFLLFVVTWRCLLWRCVV
jgi:hypothetical protein